MTPLVSLFCILLLVGCKEGRELAWASELRTLHSRAWQSFFSPVDPEGQSQTLGLAHFMTGLLAEERGEMKRAVAEYRQARIHDPKAVRIALRLGAAHMHLNELQDATRSFEEACALDPVDPRPRFLLGLLYASQDRFEEAAAQYAKVLDQNPGNLGALSQLADLYLSQERLQEALQVYERLLAERPYSAVAHFNTGVIYAKAGQWPDAIRHLKGAVELDPTHQEARLGLAVCLELSGDMASAREEFVRCLEQEPSQVRLMDHLSGLAYRLGNLEESAEWMARYLSYRPRDAQGYLRIATVRIEQGRWQEAVGLARTALAFENLEGTAVDLWLTLGLAYEKGGDYASAEKAYWEAVSGGAGQSDPYLFMARLFHDQARWRDAEKAYQSALGLSPEDPEALNGLAYLYAQEGMRLTEALMLVEKALEADPDNGAFLDTLGWITFKLGQPTEALPILQGASGRLPDSEVFDHLGEVYLALGLSEEARQAWEKALSLTKSTQVQQVEQLKLKLLQFKKGRKKR